MASSGSSDGSNPWNPGLDSTIPRDVLPLSTMFRGENVETGFDEAHELSDLSGLSPFEVVVFKPQRLVIHELLIRVTTELSVPDGPDYEELGINLRGMVQRIYHAHAKPQLPRLTALFESIRSDATAIVMANLGELRSPPKVRKTSEKDKPFLARFFGKKEHREEQRIPTFDDRLAAVHTASSSAAGTLEEVCRKHLITVVNSVIGHRGSLVGTNETLCRLIVGFALNEWGAARLGEALTPVFEEAAAAEGYRFLPGQKAPVIMNVKGASASGKSTIRPKQRALAGRLGIPWEDFALVSPDYWRKFLLDYESLGPVHKYGAMLTGHELEIIDRKLDRYMAEKAKTGAIPHLLIDRFRFDSFSIGDDQASHLLTRFGDTIFMFFMVTPPEETVERAFKRGLSTGRFKAVDDLLDHNIEAYEGMPGLFFSWALTREKKVHYEFLDNDVPEGETPRTIASGWNGRMSIYDVGGLLKIEQFKKIDVEASDSSEVYLDDASRIDRNLDFLKQCCLTLDQIQFVDSATGTVHSTVDHGLWVTLNTSHHDADFLQLLDLDVAQTVETSESPAAQKVESQDNVMVGHLAGH